MENLNALAYELRKDTLDIIVSGGSGHIGGDMSMMEVLTELYFRQMNSSTETADDPNRDYFILSKGHSMEAYYAVLCRKGFLELADVKARFSRFGSPYIGHPHNTLPGIEMNSGSLGHGLSVAVGMAKGGKMNNAPFHVYTVIGDGELAEGSVWEGAMAGGHFKLDNLTAFVDRNRLQISGTTEEVMAQDSQEQRWAAFGWNVISIDGNNMTAVDAAITAAKETKGKPTVIILNTVKGKGVSFMENGVAWHHKVMNDEQYTQALKELAERKANL